MIFFRKNKTQTSSFSFWYHKLKWKCHWSGLGVFLSLLWFSFSSEGSILAQIAGRKVEESNPPPCFCCSMFLQQHKRSPSISNWKCCFKFRNKLSSCYKDSLKEKGNKIWTIKIELFEAIRIGQFTQVTINFKTKFLTYLLTAKFRL